MFRECFRHGVVLFHADTQHRLINPVSLDRMRGEGACCDMAVDVGQVVAQDLDDVLCDVEGNMRLLNGRSLEVPVARLDVAYFRQPFKRFGDGGAPRFSRLRRTRSNARIVVRGPVYEMLVECGTVKRELEVVSVFL